MKIVHGFDRINSRLSEYVEASVETNRKSARNALRALLDECLNPNETQARWAKSRVKSTLGLSFEDLVQMYNSGELSLGKDKPPTIPPRRSDEAGGTQIG